MSGRWGYVLAIALFLGIAGAARAEQSASTPMGVPIYDPVSKHYFALMHAVTANYQSMWRGVFKQARGHWYKGVQGRLAIVDTFEKHDFLVMHFPLKYWQKVWIGLRYFCEARKLVWVDGRQWKRGSFQAWATPWNQDPVMCTGHTPTDYAPVAYNAKYRWIAKGENKGYQWYFIEYPTGHP